MHDGSNFEHRKFDIREQSHKVSIRVRPYTKGGMRLVHCFQDTSVRHYESASNIKGAASDARMVAKLSKYVDP